MRRRRGATRPTFTAISNVMGNPLLCRVDRLEERRRERGEAKPRKGGKEVDPWERVKDEETGEFFWMNIDTGEQRLEEGEAL